MFDIQLYIDGWKPFASGFKTKAEAEAALPKLAALFIFDLNKWRVAAREAA